jgi:MFS family permease
VHAASRIPGDRASIHTGPGKNSAWQKRLTLLAMCIAQGMILLDITIVNIALPSIQRELNASSGELEWVISAYALSLAALIPLSGSLGDRFGRKRFFAAGMVVFALGSVACALSASALELIAARALQGVGGAIMSALALSILSETYSGKARAGAIGIWATVAGLGFGLGPVVGGLLLGVFGWSSIFWVNVPFALVGIALTVTVVPESRNPDTRPVDVPGVLTSATGLFALIFGLIESASNSWTSAPVAASLAAGLVLLASFVWWEHRAPVPMIPPAVVKLRSFTTSCGVYLLSYASLTASRQVGTSIGLAILGAIGADAATSAWTGQAAHLPGAARRAAIGQARNVASARISSVTRALGTGLRPGAEQAFSHGYQVAVLIAGLGLIAAAIIAAFGLRDNRRRELDAAAGQPAPPADPDIPTIVAQPQHTFVTRPDGGLNHVNH